MTCFSFLPLLIVLETVVHGNGAIGNPCWNTRVFDIVPGDRCFSYIFCYYGYPVNRGWCFRGTAFDPGIRQCTTRAYAICRGFYYQASGLSPRPRFQCPAEIAEAFYPDYSRGCPTSTYFRCRYGNAETLTCRNDLFYNEGTDECDSAANIPCGAILNCPQPLTYGVYADYSQECPHRSFHRCYGGLRTEALKFRYECPEGLFYNEGIKNCDYRRNIPCSLNKKT